VYNNATRAPLLWRGPIEPTSDVTPAGASAAAGGAVESAVTNGTKSQPKRVFFVPDNGFNNDSVNALIADNGGRHDITVIKMWAMMGTVIK
jgi:hypothetical protein